MSSLANALLLIQRAVSHQTTGLNFTALRNETNIAQGTAHRLAKELVELGLLEFDPERKTYRGGLALASLGAQVIEKLDVRQSAQASLQALHQALGHVVTLGVRDGNRGVYIDKREAQGFGLRLHSEVGKAFPLHCTAMGKVMLAFGNQTDCSDILSGGLESFTPSTITDPDLLNRLLEKVYKDGYAVDDEEITRGLVCTAAPVFGLAGELIAAISFTCEKHALEELGASRVVDLVRKAGRQASTGAAMSTAAN